MNVSATMAAIAANRKQFFALVASLEQSAGCAIDEHELQSTIDADYAGKDTLSRDEAQTILMKVSRQRGSGSGSSSNSSAP